MRVLIITKIFPNALEPDFAPYNRHQFAALAAYCDSVEVFGLVPWFPGVGLLRRLSRVGPRLRVPRQERIDGLRVLHPRVAYVPKLGRPLSGLTYAASLLPRVLARRGQVDVVLGSFAYPDGWAAVVLARALGVPAVIKCHGSDVNVLSTVRTLRPNLRWALANAAAVVTNSQALAHKVVGLGISAERVHVVLNGVNTKLFRQRDRRQSRLELDLPEAGRWIVFVGRLEPQKGVGELLDAVAELKRTRPDVRLALLGDGVARARYEAQAAREDLPVLFAGACSHERVAQWVGACNVLALPSWAEGTPNVVLEALISGRKVVATNVGGIPAVVDRPVLGELVPARDSAALARALARVLDADYSPGEIVRSVCFGGWDDSARALHEVLRGALRAG